jgi:uncharacterized protein DUF1552
VSKRNATRRSFLKAVGAGATALPFYRLLENSVLAQAGQPLPLRFCGIYHPHGISMEYFAMLNGRFSGLGNDTETNFNLTYTNSGTQCVLQPFDDAATYGQSFKSKILPIEGIDLMSNANGHDTAGTILTGSYIEGGKPKNSSLDQYMAVERRLGASTRVTSIAIGVGDDSTQAGTTLSYGPGGAPLPKIIDPVQAFNTLFSGYVPTNDPAAAMAAMRTRAKGRSVIDFLNKDVGRMRTRLAAIEQQKLDQHLDSIRDLEKQFAEPTTSTTGATCTPPAKPNASTFPSLKRYNNGEPYFDVITNSFIELLTQAFACDITRFATFFMADLSYANNPLGLNADNHSNVAHTYNGSQLGNDGHPVGAGDPATWVPLAKFNRYSYGKIALLMQKLAAAGVLDNVLIYASSDMGNPALHSTRNAPTVLAGGAAGTKFRMGRRIKMQADCMTNLWCSPTDAEFKASTNNHILVSIAQAFGLTDVTSFGTQSNSGWKTGTLTGLL